MSILILDWVAASEAGPVSAGGKGWQLGRMAQLGVPVPDGFVIAASASKYRTQGDAVSEPVLDAVSNELTRRGWQDRYLVVRSSAPLEDSEKTSFAGIHHSSLNVMGIARLSEAIQTVWDSVWTPQAIAYRYRLGLNHDNLTMAVVIMPLIPAIVAGIAFTCDPISGRDNQLLISAHWGLGEALVGGKAEGDEYRLQESYIDDSLSLIDCRLGTKKLVARPAESGGTQLSETSREIAQQFALTPAQAIEIGLLARDAAYALDYACARYDIEWVWDGNQFWIVQARPATAVSRNTYAMLKHQPTYWSRGNTREVLPDPLSPLDWGIYRTMVNRMLTRSYELGGYPVLPGVQRARLFHGRLFLDASVMQWEGFDAFGLPPKAMNSLMGGHQPEIKIPCLTWQQRLRQTFRIIRYLKRSACLRRKADEIIKEAQEQARAWRNEMLPSDNRQLIQRLRQQFTIMRGLDGLFFLQGSGGGALFNLLELIEKYCPGEGHALAAALLAESDPSTTAMQGYELMTLAGIAANDPAALAWLRNCNRIGSEWNQHLPECSPFRTAFADFLERYGHRAIAESYFRNTRWREQPDYLLDAVLGLMGTEINSVRVRQQRVAQNAWQQIRQCIPIWVRPLLRHWIKAAGVESNHREAARSALIAYLEAIRLSVLELGKRLTGPSGLDRVEDIFNLTAQEILALGEGRLPAHYAARRATARHQIMTAWMAEQEPDVIVESDSCVDTLTISDTQHNISTGDGWLGTPVGAGYAKSRVCIATTPSAGHAMNQGDILAAPSTDPAWTPLFLKASGLVMETGGYLSHGAIVAREFGIPAVVNIPGVLKQLEAGEVIEVDGNRGRVRRVRD